jgi:Fe-S cluster assembly iron-binding protein IscA
MLTDNAVRKFKEFVEKQGAPDSGIRIFISGGC